MRWTWIAACVMAMAGIAGSLVGCGKGTQGRRREAVAARLRLP